MNPAPRGLPAPARGAAPWALSLFLHALLIATAAALLTRPRMPPPAPSASISLAQDRSPLPPPPPREKAEEPQPPQQQPTPLAAPVQPAAADLEPEPVPLEAIAPPDVRVALAGPAPTEAPADKAPAVSPDAPPPELFGAKGERTATRVVYVIDASGPMVAALPTVIRELERSIMRLSNDCWVQALIFKEGGFATAPGIDRDSLVKATDANKRGLIRWLSSVRADRRGDPLPAIERAVTYRPDVVFLVSKGLGDVSLTPAQAAQRRDAILARLSALNPASGGSAPGTTPMRPVSIKVIQFFDQDPGGLMRRIGEAHGGADGYTFISRKDLGLE